ncbi:hypothetical protein RvY_01816 [Ramazzottius varieornatus]|uniref:Uncharacterized protein n=1 Tax=Ramazzottius varieornatus TaxID=947166 RepID=A0A1D1UHP9_RAMVA|nr:hypothetical protein RvY_01816 [Ramazzottius varieornatus]
MARLPVYSLESIPKFAWVDYGILGLMLTLSAAIGIYQACTGGKQKTAGEFLLGNSKLHIVPVTMSLLAGFMSAVTLLGVPAETYLNGMGYWLVGVPFCVTIPMVVYIYVPIFYNLKCISVFEYLEKRFCRSIRIFAVILFVLNTVIYLAVVLYGPSTALSAVTRIPEWMCILIVGSICTFYTSIGGVKAVVWTDALQLTLMFGGSITVLAVAVYHGGGPSEVVELAQRSGRFDDLHDFSVDPKDRHTVWSVLAGGFVLWAGTYGIHQQQVQRYLSLSSRKEAQLCLWLSLPGFLALMSIVCWTGMAFYAYFRFCDPMWQGLISSADQMLPLFTMETLGHWPGVPGLVVVGVFSGSLSSISSGLNSLAALLLEDCFKLIKPTLSSTAQIRISKSAAVGFGLCSIGLAFLVSQVGGIIEFANSLYGMLSGPLLGLYVLGIFFPCTSSKGAATGYVAGLITTLWIGIGAKLTPTMYPQPIRGLYTDPATCPHIKGSYPTIKDIDLHNADIPDIFQISYFWYGPIGVTVTVVIGVLSSLLTGRTKGEDIDPRLMYPLFSRLAFFLPHHVRKKLEFGVPYDKLSANSEVDASAFHLETDFITAGRLPPSPAFVVKRDR